MSSAGILLRVLLALSLVLNGIGASLAGSEMAAAAAHATSAAATPAGCHEQVPSGAHAGHGDPSQAVDPSPAPAADDCCSYGTCACACVQLPALAATDSLFDPPRLEHETVSESAERARPAPALPHLIRPPIA